MTSYQQRALVEETAKISHSTLKDVNWQVKLVMSSDKLSTIKEPLVNVEFDLQTEDGNKKTTLEMNKAEFKDFIESLEAANKTVLQLRS
ncbi:COMM domain-containing protein 8-like [Hydractinia symbiolongicarpus]|uniref:COMM domain-containing protein 8-like n=1 Tax=Hydractinia symbiolongicarpus TaxID=13093 RepID=UPI00254DD2C6|nr:COMM domain-containing protein 8-like [Hydractinia symbiolongicarpus]